MTQLPMSSKPGPPSTITRFDRLPQIPPVSLKGQVASFKVYSDPVHYWYWVVLVFKSRRYMQQAHLALSPPRVKPRHSLAMVMPQSLMKRERGKWRLALPWLGYALFAQTHLGMGTQCHEALHMAVHYMLYTKQPIRPKINATPSEEKLATYTAHCASALNKGFLRHGLYR
jgi:hypothetical protein